MEAVPLLGWKPFLYPEEDGGRFRNCYGLAPALLLDPQYRSRTAGRAPRPRTALYMLSRPNSSLDSPAPQTKSFPTPMPPALPVSSDSIRRLIVDLLPDTARTGDNPVIFGAGGALDSLGLVNFLADLEYRLAEVYGRDLVLASERAMSRSRSPFRDVDTLTAYILELLGE